jgi:hypothetical protein
MIGADEIEAAILEMINEDRYGLYEIIWTLNTSHPTFPRPTRLLRLGRS